MKYEFGPKSKLIGYSIGFLAGAYSLLFGKIRPQVHNWVDLIAAIFWYLLIGGATLGNAWGMLHTSEAMHNSGDSTQ